MNFKLKDVWYYIQGNVRYKLWYYNKTRYERTWYSSVFLIPYILKNKFVQELTL
mgnify:CR=1 FL=1